MAENDVESNQELDQELVRRVQRGDSTAFDALVLPSSNEGTPVSAIEARTASGSRCRSPYSAQRSDQTLSSRLFRPC